MDRALEEQVWARARFRCEYCLLPAAYTEAPFQIDHIIARKHGGETVAANLALSCYSCNSYKGPNIASLDPSTGKLVRLFHPRKDRWTDHFAWEGPSSSVRQPSRELPSSSSGSIIRWWSRPGSC